MFAPQSPSLVNVGSALAATAGALYGGGAGGWSKSATTGAVPGAAGGQGVVIIEEFY